MIPSLDPGMLKLKHWSVPALKNLQYLTREINMFIEVGTRVLYFLLNIKLFRCWFEKIFTSFCKATEAVTSICTLYELGQSLAGLKDKTRYEELKMGPLCKLPLVHRMFKIDGNTKDDDIHEIETVDILKVLLKKVKIEEGKYKYSKDYLEFLILKVSSTEKPCNSCSF